MAVVNSTGIGGTYLTAQTRDRRAGGPDGEGNMVKTVVGSNAVAGIGGSGILSPHFFMPETHIGRERGWRYNFDPKAFVSEAATTDGALGCEWFETLTNSGTATLTSAQAGYEGYVLSTTGAASGNTNSWIGVDSGFPVASRIFWISQALYLPDPNVAAYDFWLGFFNKQAAPGGTAPTDGAWFKCTTSGGAMTIIGQMAKASTTASTATLYTVASGAPQSIELALEFQGQGGVDFYIRVPATPPTFVASDKWVLAGSLSASANWPTTTTLIRPTMAHITRTAATHALNMESAIYGFERTRLR